MNRKRGYLYILLAAMIFSTTEVALKGLGGVFAPMQITCLRFLIGGLLLVPFALRSMKKKGAAFTRADVVYTDHVIVLHLQRFKIDRLHDEQLGPP